MRMVYMRTSALNTCPEKPIWLSTDEAKVISPIRQAHL